MDTSPRRPSHKPLPTLVACAALIFALCLFPVFDQTALADPGTGGAGVESASAPQGGLPSEPAVAQPRTESSQSTDRAASGAGDGRQEANPDASQPTPADSAESEEAVEAQAPQAPLDQQRSEAVEEKAEGEPTALSASANAYVNVYRFYNSYDGNHHYTLEGDEFKDLIERGWRYEGVGWVSPVRSSVPVYRLYNPNSGDHHFTTDKVEYDRLHELGWTQEGIAWYSDTSADAVDIFRLFNPYETIGTHHYTRDADEYRKLPGHGWVPEGVAWKSSPAAHVAPEAPIEATDPWGVSWSINADATLSEVKDTKTRLQGIDVSGYQPDIRISDLDDVDFVVVKATEGTGYKNPYFFKQASETLKSGKLLGVYHYAHPGRDESAARARAEADHFVDTVMAAGFDNKCIYFLDWESSGADNRVFSTASQYAWTKAFLDRVASRTGSKPMLYTSQSYARWAVKPGWGSVAPQYDLWVAQYLYAPGTSSTYTSQQDLNYKEEPGYYGAWKAPKIWQYTSTGRVDGYGADLDLNIFYGTRAHWRSYQ